MGKNTKVIKSKNSDTATKNKKLLIKYIRMCIKLEDWHGVRDAAADIEILEAGRSSVR